MCPTSVRASVLPGASTWGRRVSASVAVTDGDDAAPATQNDKEITAHATGMLAPWRRWPVRDTLVERISRNERRPK